MPGHHTQKQKRQAEHVADSERRRGESRKDAARIGWATVSVGKALEFKPHKMRPRDSIAHAEHGTYTVSPDHAVRYTSSGGSPQRVGKFGSRSEAVGAAQSHHASIGNKSFRLMSLDAYYDLVKDQAGRSAYHADAARRVAPDPTRTAHVDRPPPAVSDVASRPQSERRGFPRKPKPTIQVKPISNAEAMEHLRSGTYSPSKQKSLRWLAALKALSTGYGRTSGGGALKAANRGGRMPLLGPSGRAAGKPGGHYRTRGITGRANFGPDGRPGPRGDEAEFGRRSNKLRRAMEAMAAPTGPAKPPSVYLPGVHNPKSPLRGGGLKKKPPAGAVGKGGAPLVVSSGSPRAIAGGDAAELSNSIHNVVIKSEGAEMSRQNQNVDFDDLFKSELADDHLVDCPHCDAPITKSDLAKAHKGKGAVTHQSGPKHGKSSAYVRDHNPEGGTTRGGDGHGVHSPSRGVPGAKKTDAAVGVQNGKGSRARKGGADSSIEDDDDVDKSAGSATVGPRAADQRAEGEVKKSITIRGTEFVQYIDDGSDAALAKSILEGRLGGTPPTQPLDLNNDLTRLLV